MSITDRPLIYLATPYSHPEAHVREARFIAAAMMASRLMLAGHYIFSPITHTHPIAVHGSLPTDFAFWKGYDYTLLDRCAELWVVMLPGWEASVGIAGEILYMQEQGKPVKYLDIEGRFVSREEALRVPDEA
jgi:hypothetical protein